MKDPIAKIIEDYRDVVSRLSVLNDPSLHSFTQNEFCKSLILSSASYFEHRISSLIGEVVKLTSHENEMVRAMVKQKVIDRQYHTYFEWKETKVASINKFLSLFGETFSAGFKKTLRDDESLRNSVLAFMEVGGLRNQLVHMNYATFPINKTFDELISLYGQSKLFVDEVEKALMVHAQPIQPSEN
jgi:hypothetical protein